MAENNILVGVQVVPSSEEQRGALRSSSVAAVSYGSTSTGLLSCAQ